MVLDKHLQWSNKCVAIWEEHEYKTCFMVFGLSVWVFMYVVPRVILVLVDWVYGNKRNQNSMLNYHFKWRLDIFMRMLFIFKK